MGSMIAYGELVNSRPAKKMQTLQYLFITGLQLQALSFTDDAVDEEKIKKALIAQAKEIVTAIYNALTDAKVEIDNEFIEYIINYTSYITDAERSREQVALLIQYPSLLQNLINFSEIKQNLEALINEAKKFKQQHAKDHEKKLNPDMQMLSNRYKFLSIDSFYQEYLAHYPIIKQFAPDNIKQWLIDEFVEAGVRYQDKDAKESNKVKLLAIFSGEKEIYLNRQYLSTLDKILATKFGAKKNIKNEKEIRTLFKTIGEQWYLLISQSLNKQINNRQVTRRESFGHFFASILRQNRTNTIPTENDNNLENKQ